MEESIYQSPMKQEEESKHFADFIHVYAPQGDVRDSQQHQDHQAQRLGGELPEEDRENQARRV